MDAPEMIGEFDPAEFEMTSAPAAPEADYRLLLDEMRKAGAEGVRDELAPVAAELRADVAALKRRFDEYEAATGQIQRAANDLDKASRELWSADLKRAAVLFLMAIAAFFAAFWIANALKKPTKVPYGCTSWNTKTKTCKGEWARLNYQT